MRKLKRIRPSSNTLKAELRGRCVVEPLLHDSEPAQLIPVLLIPLRVPLCVEWLPYHPTLTPTEFHKLGEITGKGRGRRNLCERLQDEPCFCHVVKAASGASRPACWSQ